METDLKRAKAKINTCFSQAFISNLFLQFLTFGIKIFFIPSSFVLYIDPS